MVYEKLKGSLKSRKSLEAMEDPLVANDPSALEYFLTAATAKLIAVCATYPHEVQYIVLFNLNICNE